MTNTSCTTSDHRWQRRKDSRPGEIIEAAFDLFAERGFSNTKMDEIAQKAGISKGSIYNYFKSKEAIFEVVVTEDIIPMVDKIENVIASNQESPDKLISCLIHGLIAHTQGTRLELIPKLIVSESGNFPELAKFYVEQVVKRVRGIMETVIQRGIKQNLYINCDPKIAARLLLAPIIHEQIWRCTLIEDENTHDFELFIDTHLKIFLHGIRRVA